MTYYEFIEYMVNNHKRDNFKIIETLWVDIKSLSTLPLPLNIINKILPCSHVTYYPNLNGNKGYSAFAAFLDIHPYLHYQFYTPEWNIHFIIVFKTFMNIINYNVDYQKLIWKCL